MRGLVSAGARRAVLGVSLTATVLGGGACGSSTHTAQRSISAAAVDGKPGFTPATITVDKGDKVVLDIANTTAKAHGFTIEGYKTKQKAPIVVEPGAKQNLTFIAGQSGTFRIFCQLHPAHQPATLVVR